MLGLDPVKHILVVENWWVGVAYRSEVHSPERVEYKRSLAYS